MIRKHPFLCKDEIQRDYRYQHKGGQKMTWFPDKEIQDKEDKDAETKTDEE